MSTLTGNVKDFQPLAIGSATLVFTAYSAATTTGGSLLLPKQVRKATASDGSFSVDLASWANTNPRTAYKLEVEYTPAGMTYPVTVPIPWPVVVTGSGLLIDMFAIETTPGQFLTKGDKGDDGDSVMQDAFDALEARMPQPGAKDRFRVIDLNGKTALEVDDVGQTIVGDTALKATDGFRVTDKDGYIALEVTPDGKTRIYDPTFTAGGTSGSGTAITTLHAFLAVGQSNMSGRGLPISAGLDPNDPRIFQYGANRRTLEPATVPLDMHDTASGLSPATTFAREYLKAQPPNVGILIIPAAHGATGFTSAADTLTWTVGAASAPAYDLPALAVTQAIEALTAAQASGYTVTLKAALWHQGENNGSMSQTTYEGLLDTLIGYFKTQLSSPGLLFVVGQMCPEGMDVTPAKYNIDAAHQATPARVTHTGFAKATRGGNNTGDTTHFSRTGIEYLGKTYLSGYWEAAFNEGATPGTAINVAATKTGTTVRASWDAPPKTLTQSTTYDLYGTGTGYVWTAPASRITAYKVETKTGTGAWTEATRAHPANRSETVTVPAGTTLVRVTALNGATASTPVTVTAVGA